MCWLGPGRQQLDPARKSPRALRCTEILLNLREFDVNGTATALICRVRPERGLATSQWPRRVHALRKADWDKFHTDRQSRLGSHSSGRARAAISPETSFLFLFLFLFLIPYSYSLFASYSRIRLVGEKRRFRLGLGKDGRNPIGKDLHDFDQSYCARGEHAGEPPRPFSVHAGTRSAWLKLCERFWQERQTGGSDEGRLSTSSTPSSGSISRELSPTVQSPASDAPLCPLASALPAGVLLIPADTSPSVRPKKPIALMGQPTLAVPTSSHSGTHASSL